ncbi:double zinc ribbon domain-containing protein [Ditylenchus destructor]|nr:double zinc ribbon domain-containing protein [Ditylenchus destructor]
MTQSWPQMDTADSSKRVLAKALSCPSCGEETVQQTDKFCRKCGLRVLFVCTKCQHSVRSDDKFCSNCGARRWKLIDYWRYGILHRSPIHVVGILAVVGSSWLALYYFVKTRMQRLR